MSFIQEANANAAQTILKNLQKRQMEGYFCQTKEEATTLALSLMPKGATISSGGSMSLVECGLLNAVKQENYTYIDRMTATNAQEKREIYAKSVMADFYLMSTNAITMEGELVNIDGFGNRVGCLCAGPEHVILIVGMNKVVKSVKSGLDRIKTKAAPPNAVRLTKNTPCAKTGVCGECFSPDCICSQTVITRRSGVPGRIKIILVNEDLGY